MMKRMLSIIIIMNIVLSGVIISQTFFSKAIITRTSTGLPDLTISQNDITLSTSEPISGEAVIINATVWNNGSTDAINVNVSFYEENSIIGSKIVDLPIWKIQAIDSIIDTMDGANSIAVDSSDGIHVSYFDYHQGDLKYAYRPNGGSWTTSIIVSSGQVGMWNSIAVDGANGIHISYRHNNHDDLRYAYKPTGGDWNISIVDSGGNIGYDNSIAVDSANGIHISYHSGAPTNDLRYVYKPKGGNWAKHTIDNGSDVGSSTSIAVDSANGIHVSYRDQTNSALKYAYKSGSGSWTTYTVDSIGYINRETSIALDRTNGVHISYFDETNHDLKYAYKPNGGVWSNFTVDSEGVVGGSNSINVDGKNGTYISYLDSSNGDLKYAYMPDGGNWTIKTIDSEGNVGDYNSLTVDRKNGIHIGYFDKTKNLLKYAKWDVGKERIQTSISWTPTIAGSRNITVKLDENNDIKELNEMNNEATIIIQVNGTADTDLDGLTNDKEYSIGTDPHNNDTDGDNLGDGFEMIFSKTDPTKWDSDGNGIGDGLEFLQKNGYIGGIKTLSNDWIGMTIKWSKYTMFVSTNSSVLEAKFDKDNKKLDILVSGVKGTIGVCNISIPKSLINSTENISIKLDGKPINFTIKQTKYNYYIIAKYKHSTHKFSADFGQIGKEPIISVDDDKDEGFSEYYLIIAIVIIIIIIILIALIRIKKGNLNNNIPQLPPEQLSKILEKKYEKGKMTEDTYKDIKSQLKKYKEK